MHKVRRAPVGWVEVPNPTFALALLGLINYKASVVRGEI